MESDDLQQWWLALAAINMETYGGSHTTLRMDDSHPTSYQEELRDAWDVTSSQTLVETLQWLLRLNHSKQFEAQLGRLPIAWDIARYVWVVRAALQAGYVNRESSAWELFEPLTAPTACYYGSWKDYADDFLAARWLWLADRVRDPRTVAQHERYISAVGRLLDPANHTSPWQRTEWSTPANYLVLRWNAPTPQPTEPHPHRRDEFDQLLRRLNNKPNR